MNQAELSCSLFFTTKTVQSNSGNNVYLTELEGEAQEAFHIFYSESFAGSSKIENLVILNACYLPIYSLATANGLIHRHSKRGYHNRRHLSSPEAGCNYQG